MEKDSCGHRAVAAAARGLLLLFTAMAEGGVGARHKEKENGKKDVWQAQYRIDSDAYMIREAFTEVNEMAEYFKRVKDIEHGMKKFESILAELVSEVRGGKRSEELMSNVEVTGRQEGSGSMTDEMGMIRNMVKELSKEVDQLKRKDSENEREKSKLKEEITKLTLENSRLKMRLDAKDDEAKEQNESIEKLRSDQEGWKKVQGNKESDFRKILMEQQAEQKESIEKEVIRTIKKKVDVIRGVVDKKKCAIVFGITEKKDMVRNRREREEAQSVKELIKVLNDEEDEALEKEIDEIHRIGKYVEGGKRPIRIKFKSQSAATDVLQRTGKLKEMESYKTVWIKKDLNEDERTTEKELWNEMKEKNGQRSEEEKKKFYWKVKDGRMKKWFL